MNTKNFFEKRVLGVQTNEKRVRLKPSAYLQSLLDVIIV
jgi:hypothetical protein